MKFLKQSKWVLFFVLLTLGGWSTVFADLVDADNPPFTAEEIKGFMEMQKQFDVINQAIQDPERIEMIRKTIKDFEELQTYRNPDGSFTRKFWEAVNNR